ncbi:MAG: DUF6456 domain-containing protein [Pseudomonadota bacterium]
MDQIERLGSGSGFLPAWLPEAAKNYLVHTEVGLPIRELARKSGCHASTVLRQIRKFETRRDDPLVDAALRKLGADLGPGVSVSQFTQSEDVQPMAAHQQAESNEEKGGLSQDAARILRRLCETGAVLAVALDMEKAVVVREGQTGSAQKTAVVDREVAEYMALQDWITGDGSGRVTKYKITPTGRLALQNMLSGEPHLHVVEGMSEAPAQFADQRREWGERMVADPETGQRRKMRYNLAESPLTALARRRDKDGKPFLNDDLVSAGERLREDFELAQMGSRVTQNWDRFLTGGARGGFAPDSGVGNGPESARQRVAGALADLGPGLSDVVLRCCCYLEGLETAEKKLGWSARSGKIVLRIALQQLKRHYDETTGPGGGLIG